MSNKQNDILMEQAIENVDKVIKDGPIPIDEDCRKKLITQEYERLMEREE